MVVGIVIGSGIFFKADKVFVAADGNAIYSILSWVISGFIMVTIATSFGVMATKYEKINGVVDYAEVTCGKSYAFYVGWFMSMIYYPAMTSVLAWVSAKYTLILFDYNAVGDSPANGPTCITLALFYLVFIYFLNTIAPRIAGKFQVSSTAVKLVPLLVIGIVGLIVGLFNSNLYENFDIENISSHMPDVPEGTSTGLFPAICATIFAYEGWVVATTINSEIKDSKRNLPIALCIGTLIIVIAYTLYNAGILGLANIVDVTKNSTSVAFAYFGPVVSKIIFAFVVISCLGTLNGLMLGCCRGIYSLSVRREGLSPDVFSQVDKKTNMPHNSAAFALLTCAVWFVYFIMMSLRTTDLGVLSNYAFDSSELPIITIYPMYVPILIILMVKEKDLHPFKRLVLPLLSLVGIVVIVTASIISHKMGNVWYLIVFAIIMALGAIVKRIRDKEKRTHVILESSSESN